MSQIALYCSASDRLDDVYYRAADAAGRLLAERGHALLYGGGANGLMGRAARAAHAAGGHVVGVIPEALRAIEGVAYDAADELIVTDTMAERKSILYTRADAFLVLPGGMGTLEEFMEVLTLRTLGYHDKPIALLNTAGCWDGLLGVFDTMIARGFARPAVRERYVVAATPGEAVDALERAIGGL